MKPERENYEIWLTDWLDGNLDQEQAEQFLAFLEENPDIREEADSISWTRLASATDQFSKKEDLRRSPADLTSSQIEYLSVAYLENDLLEGQLADLNQNIDLYPENKKLFKTVQKIRLIPQDHHFRQKSTLIKLTAGERILRLSAIGLSAAAVIALLIFVPKFLSRPGTGDAQNIIQSNNLPVPGAVQKTLNPVKTPEPVVSAKNTTREKEIPVTAPDELNNPTLAIVATDISSFDRILPVPKVTRIPELSKTTLISETTGNMLIASNNNFIKPANVIYDDERSRLSRFIARTFREKILKEDKPVDTPLKSYEFAEAGIEGLNKLFGWKMALVKTSDEQGELKSVYFSSKLLKFNAPVKKSVSVQ